MEMDIYMWLTMETIEFNSFLLVSSGFLRRHLEYLVTYVGSTSVTSAVTLAGFSTSGGSGYSELNSPAAIYVTLNATLFILDSLNYRVMKYLPGQPLGFAVAGNRGTGTTLDKIGTSYAIDLDDQWNIYISEYSNHRVTMWFNGNTTAGIIVCITRIDRYENIDCLIFFRWQVMVVLDPPDYYSEILGVSMWTQTTLYMLSIEETIECRDGKMVSHD